MQDLPSYVTLGANSNAIDGGIKLWHDISDPAAPTGTLQAKTAKSTTKPG
jgi:hypothetical protein